MIKQLEEIIVIKLSEVIINAIMKIKENNENKNKDNTENKENTEENKKKDEADILQKLHNLEQQNNINTKRIIDLKN